jgi:hypothetical protein
MIWANWSTVRNWPHSVFRGRLMLAGLYLLAIGRNRPVIRPYDRFNRTAESLSNWTLIVQAFVAV